MFLTDFCTRKYTGGIISRVGIFLTVTPADQQNKTLIKIFNKILCIFGEIWAVQPKTAKYIWFERCVKAQTTFNC